MKFAAVALSEAKGKILGHNIAGANGQRLFRKGKPLTDEDLENLRALGRTTVYVADGAREEGEEPNAARRGATASCGAGRHISGGSSGRVNLLADEMGI